ncbi:MAG: class I SAM-dependent methyltransferase [Kordiimonadaceae bacterium]|nr:class I SAM-dependent methyltransferase [Kordiimonadaceae bacterium]MBO6569686.1 class I SAM-dependent methyltransferase [Kordiimonadaceae bacterium]MBO6966221.1 class I SAM-dependent methyltransferase [Kordiimonadaceae bacterium]
MKKVLHVGCAKHTLANMPEGFQGGDWQEVRFDINPDCKPDIVGTILDMEAVPDESMDAIFSSHNIEHVFFHEVPTVLKEFRRVLKPDGFCVIFCPDIQEVAKSMAEGLLDEPLYHAKSGPITPLDIMYGHSKSIKNGRVYMAHKTGFSLKLLAKRVERAGFRRYRGSRIRHQHELRIVASKGPMDQDGISSLFEAYTKINRAPQPQ